MFSATKKFALSSARSLSLSSTRSVASFTTFSRISPLSSLFPSLSASTSLSSSSSSSSSPFFSLPSSSFGTFKDIPHVDHNEPDSIASAESELRQSDSEFRKIFQRNREWVAKTKEKDPNYFTDLAALPQAPTYLFIGCSDSRVPANTITGLGSGELFVHRNIANLVVNTDMNLLSVLQFSVDVLKVKHIIVCGHYGCGGVKAAMEKNDVGLLENWLRNIRDVQRLHNDELIEITDENEKWNRLVELNVEEQCLNLFKTGTVQNRLRQGDFPRIHGLVYDISKGYLRELDIDYRGYYHKYKHIYSLYADYGERPKILPTNPTPVEK